MNTFNEKILLELINKVDKKKFPVDGGNCGTFAIGLITYIEDTYNIILPFGLITDVDDKEDLYYSEPDIYHVVIEYNGKMYDGHGITNLNELKAIAKDQYGNNNPYYYGGFMSTDENVSMIKNNTNYTKWVGNFYHYFKDINKKKKLEEMPVISPNNEKIGDKNDTRMGLTNDRYEDTKIQFKLLNKFKIGDYVYEVYKRTKSEDSYRIFVLFNNEIIGFIGAMTYKNSDISNQIVNKVVNSFPKILSVYIYPEHRGKGLGYDIYKILINTTGGIISDEELTKHSLNIWKKLLRDFNVYKLVKNENIEKIDDVTKEIGSYDENFIASVEPLEIKENNFKDYFKF